MRYAQTVSQVLVPRGNHPFKAGQLFPGTSYDVEPGQIVFTQRDRRGKEITTVGLDPSTVTKATADVRILVATPLVRKAVLNAIGGQVHFDESQYMPIDRVEVEYGQATLGRGSAYALTLDSEVLENQPYYITLQLKSRRNSREYGVRGDSVQFVKEMPEDLDDIASPKAHLFGGLVHKANMLSLLARPDIGRKEYVAFAIALGGGTGTRISDLTVGTSIKPTADAREVRFDEHLMRAVAKVRTDATFAGFQNATIVPMAGDPMAYGATASPVDGMIVFSIDHQDIAVHDRLLGARVNCNVDYGDSFRAEGALVRDAFVGAANDISSGEEWQKVYEQSGAQNRTGLPQIEGGTDSIVKRDSFIEKDAYYDCYTFFWEAKERGMADTQVLEQIVRVLVKVELTTTPNGTVSRNVLEVNANAALQAFKTAIETA